MNLNDVHTTWVELVDRCFDEGYGALRPTEKVWFNTQALLQAIENGGLISYFYNSSADHLPDALAALDELDAVEMRGLVEQVAALFEGGVPGDVESRNDVIASWPDDGSVEERLEPLDQAALREAEALEPVLAAYLVRHGLVSG